jgi:hypothetical protein
MVVGNGNGGGNGNGISYEVSGGSSGRSGYRSKLEIFNTENKAIAASVEASLSNSTYFDRTLPHNNTRVFRNLVIVNLSSIPIEFHLNGLPYRYLVCQGNDELVINNVDVLQWTNATIKNRSAANAIDANEIIINMW